MNENRIFPMSADLFDNSSNSSNLLKLDIFPTDFIIGGSNSNSNSSLGITTIAGFVARNLPTNVSSSSALSPSNQYTNTSNTSMDSLRENPMLNSTASISIPQRSSGNNSSTFYNQPRIMADFSEYGLDALDASSLSPSYIQDSNLSSTPHSSSSHNYNGLIFINNSSSTLHANNNNNNNNNSGQSVGNSTPTPTGDLIIYEIPTSNSNTMWSDIGNAMVATKTEPFPMEDDYIFQLDKTDLIHSPTLAELNDETLLEDLNIEDLIPAENDTTYLISSQGHLHQLQTANSGLTSQQLLQQHHGINQMQNTQHHLQQNQQNLLLNINRDAGKMFDDHNNTGSSSSPFDIQHSTPIKGFQSSAAFSPGSQASSSPLLMHSITPPSPQNHPQFLQQQQSNMVHHTSNKTNNSHNRVTRIHELLKKDYSQSPDRSILGQSVPGPSTSHMLISGGALSPVSSGFGSISGHSSRKQLSMSSNNSGGVSRLSSSAPTHLQLDEIMQQRRSDFSFDHPIWRRREPRQHLLSTGSSIAEAESISSLSTASILSPEHDEGYSDYDTDHSDDYSSDNGSDNEDDPNRGPNPGNSKNKERYFWQYNVQAKGPKGQRLVIKTHLEDPHVLNEVTDPVFSPNCSVRGIKHSGKARKGDGNDLTPNPRKLHAIGKELDKLGRQINEMPPVSELPTNSRQKTRKEKNKLASRACRLKKKAQHEANKIKLYGLEIEHKKLLNGISDVKNILAMKYQNQSPTQQNQSETNEGLNQEIERIAQTSTTVQIAGNSTEFVNRILDKVKGGQSTGGLEDLRNM